MEEDNLMDDVFSSIKSPVCSLHTSPRKQRSPQKKRSTLQLSEVRADIEEISVDIYSDLLADTLDPETKVFHSCKKIGKDFYVFGSQLNLPRCQLFPEPLRPNPKHAQIWPSCC